MHLIVWIFFGTLLGVVTNILEPRPNRGGIIASIIVAVLGSIVGGFIATALVGFSSSGQNILALLISMAGGIFVLFFGRGVQRI